MRLAALAAVLVASLALPACASPAADDWYTGDPSGKMRFDREGPYFALTGIRSLENFDTSGTNLEAGDSDIGIGMRGGLRLEKNLAVELAVESVDGYELSVGPLSTDLDRIGACVSGKFFLLPHRIQPYITAGLGYAEAQVDDLDIDDSGPFARMGAGIDFYLTPEVAVFAEVNYNRTFGDLDDLDHVDAVVGLLFRF